MPNGSVGSPRPLPARWVTATDVPAGLVNAGSPSQLSKDVPVAAKSSKSGSATPDNMVIAKCDDRTLREGRGHAVTMDGTRREERAEAAR
jgi:hypothetical protein